jgi:hypothetical protein
MYGCGCDCGDSRRFISKEEKLKMLKAYKEDLENEVKGVDEAIKNVSKNN